MFKKCKKLAWGFLVSAFVCGGSVAFNHLFAAPPVGIPKSYEMEMNDYKDKKPIKVLAKFQTEKKDYKNDKGVMQSVLSLEFQKDEQSSTEETNIHLGDLYEVIKSQDFLQATIVQFEGVNGIFTDENSKTMRNIFNKMEEFESKSLANIGPYTFKIEEEEKKEIFDKDKCVYGEPFDPFYDIRVPNVKNIGDYAFSGNDNLKYVDFSKVESIGEYAFYRALDFEGTINLPNIKTLGKRSFYDSFVAQLCANKLRNVMSEAFMNCRYLDWVKSKRLTSIGKRAFYNCPSLIGVGNKIYDGTTKNGSNVEVYSLGTLSILEEDAFRFSPKIEKLVYIPTDKTLEAIGLSGEKDEIFNEDFATLVRQPDMISTDEAASRNFLVETYEDLTAKDKYGKHKEEIPEFDDKEDHYEQWGIIINVPKQFEDRCKAFNPGLDIVGKLNNLK